ncbi:MAG: hypothetical protein Q4A06_05150 [Cardiobacteriaceae bacterium]|nr:hypothetical protein [Cardiobacteriaceae bacterium]
MNLAPALLPHSLNLLAWLLLLALLIRNACCVRWRVLARHPQTLHIFFFGVLCLAFLAALRIGTQPGLWLHLSGITAATLIMGRRLALLAGTLALLLLVATGRETFSTLAAHALLFVALPAYVSYGFCRLLQKILPHNPFIFTLGAGFFGGILALAATMLGVSLLLAASGLYGWPLLWDKYLKFLPIVIYPEGFLNGLLVTVMVAFHPHLLSAFNPDSYFNSQRPQKD